MKPALALAVSLTLALVAACGAVTDPPEAAPDATADPGPGTPDAAPECTTDAACGDPALPYCVDLHCVACADASACSAEAPVCSETDHTCGACRDQEDCIGYPGRRACGPDGACVQCVADNYCPNSAPVCEDFACRGCVADAECDTGACDLASGACYTPAQIVYVAPSGSSAGTCGTAAQPCDSLGAAAPHITAGRPIIVMRPGTYPAQLVTAAPGPIDVHATGATISASGAATGLFLGNLIATVRGLHVSITGVSGQQSRAIDMNSPGQLTLRDVQIRGTGGMVIGIESDAVLDADAVDIQTSGLALNTFGSGSLTLTRSRIHQSAGISVGSPTFLIENNVISYCTGVGLRLDSPAGTKRLWFNTFLANGSALSSGATELEIVRAVPPDPLGRFSATDNVFVNGRPYTWNGATHTGIHVVEGRVDRALIDEPNHPPGTGYALGAAQLTSDGHVAAGSAAIDAGLAGTGPTDDLDGDDRDVGPPDLGADEYQP